MEVVKGMGKKEMNIILNMKTRKRNECNERDVEKMTKIPVMGRIDYDRNVIDSVIMKKPVVLYKPHSPASVGFMKLAAKINGVTYKPSPIKKVFNLFDNIRNLIPIQKSREESFKKSK
jgi:MinD-like ATPase involved in chromosome partitioning or flagellar assembly